MDSFATAISLALQHGVPLRLLVDKFSRTRFEPSGFTGNPEVPRASSIMDYIFRWLGVKFLKDVSAIQQTAAPAGGKIEVVTLGTSVAKGSEHGPGASNGENGKTLLAAIAAEMDAPTCSDCGSLMIRNGSCHKCPNCGTTSGCS
jgi:ribonucleoside-diphosphate reductase alpha chain